MKCTNCNFNNSEDSRFCKKCGERLADSHTVKNPDNLTELLTKNETKKQANASNNIDPTQENHKSSEHDNIIDPANSNKTIQEEPCIDNSSSNEEKSDEYANQYKSKNISQQYTNQAAQKGVVTQAWQDITKQDKWFSKTIILSLINMIPILNFAVIGNIVNWAKESITDENIGFPAKSMKQEYFILGLQEVLIFLVYSILIGAGGFLVKSMFGSLPFIGTLIGLAIFVFGFVWNSYVSLSVIKAITSNDFGQAFNTKELIKNFKKNSGSIICAYLLPALICGLIMLIAIGIIAVICFGVMFASIAGYISSISAAISSFNVNTIIEIIVKIFSLFFGFTTPSILIMYFIYSVMTTIEKLIRYRAVAIWVKRYAEDWV